MVSLDFSRRQDDPEWRNRAISARRRNDRIQARHPGGPHPHSRDGPRAPRRLEDGSAGQSRYCVRRTASIYGRRLPRASAPSGSGSAKTIKASRVSRTFPTALSRSAWACAACVTDCPLRPEPVYAKARLSERRRAGSGIRGRVGPPANPKIIQLQKIVAQIDCHPWRLHRENACAATGLPVWAGL